MIRCRLAPTTSSARHPATVESPRRRARMIRHRSFIAARTGTTLWDCMLPVAGHRKRRVLNAGGTGGVMIPRAPDSAAPLIEEGRNSVWPPAIAARHRCTASHDTGAMCANRLNERRAAPRGSIPLHAQSPSATRPVAVHRTGSAGRRPNRSEAMDFVAASAPIPTDRKPAGENRGIGGQPEPPENLPRAGRAIYCRKRRLEGPGNDGQVTILWRIRRPSRFRLMTGGLFATESLNLRAPASVYCAAILIGSPDFRGVIAVAVSGTGGLPESSNGCCHPGRGGGPPMLVESRQSARRINSSLRRTRTSGLEACSSPGNWSQTARSSLRCYLRKRSPAPCTRIERGLPCTGLEPRPRALED
jgi:hypothetical protein